MSSSLKRSREDDGDDEEEFVDEEKPKVEAKKQKSTAAKPSGDAVFEIGAKRKVTVNIFKGRLYVNIREFYEDKTGEEKPGKTGIALTKEQWESLKEQFDDINKAIEERS